MSTTFIQGSALPNQGQSGATGGTGQCLVIFFVVTTGGQGCATVIKWVEVGDVAKLLHYMGQPSPPHTHTE